MKTSNALLGLALFLGGTSVSALSLGDVRGTVVLGRPLDVLFDVVPDSGIPLDAACLSASATAGDTRIDSSRMQIAVLPATAGRTLAVRVRSRDLVSEPILSVQLVAGCSAQVSRTYHLFADPPTTAAAVAAAALPALPRAGRPAPGAAGASDDTPAAQPQRAPARAARAAPAPVAAKRAPRTKAAPAPAAAAPVSRLVVEPLEDWLLAPPALRLSGELQALPAQASTPERTQAAALWQALNGTADDSAAQSEHARLLTGQTAAARAEADQARAALQPLQQRLDRLEAERFSPTLLYALLALWIATLAGWLWYALHARRQADASASGWRAAVAGSAAHEVFADEDPPMGFGRAGGPPGLQEQDLDIFLSDDPPPARNTPWALHTENAPVQPPAPELSVPPAPPKAPPPAPVQAVEALPISSVPALHVVHPEDLFDLQQQAEFFISVGEHDQAIAILTRHINENHAVSPWAYLELLRLYRSLSRVGPFNQLRTQFQQHFNAQMPEFAAFNAENRRLLDYPEVLAGIEALWSDDSVVPLLESLLFSRHAGADAQRFDLCAFDDLLMLYSIARTTPASARGVPPPRPRTTPAATELSLPASNSLEAPLPIPPAAPSMPAMDLDLDLDLDDFVLPEPPVPGPASADTGNMIEYDLLLPGQDAPNRMAPLDIDLSAPETENLLDFPPVTLSGLPEAHVKAAPSPNQPVGFGANSDRVEARFDLEEREERKPGQR